LSPILTAVTVANDAAAILAALMPLIERQMNGGAEVTQEEMRAALAGKDDALRKVDELIAAKGG
jgi:hypothetical protein